MALIAYHRLQWQIAAVQQSGLHRGWRHELWLLRLAAAIQPSVAGSSGFFTRELGEFTENELTAAKEEIDEVQWNFKISSGFRVVVEGLLIIGLLVVLLD